MILLEGTRRSQTLNFPNAYTVLLPDAPRAGERFPLVLCLHDLGEDRQSMAYAIHSATLPGQMRTALVIPDGRRSCFLDMAHGPRWNAYLERELLPALCASMPCDSSRLSVLGLGAGALGALALARRGLPCVLIDPCTQDPLARNAMRWPCEAEWLSLFEGREAQWQPGPWDEGDGLLLGNPQALTAAAAQLGLRRWRAEPSEAKRSDLLARALEWLENEAKG